ncbi:MAG: uroporphyrinogen decarboxylase family protein, partial [Planctomycetota bacterium]
MNSREKILTALNHKEPDRIPRDLGGTESSGMTAFSLHKLQNRLGLTDNIKIFEPYQYVGYIPEKIKEQFKIDTANLTREPEQWTSTKAPQSFVVELPAGWQEESDATGDTVVKNAEGTVVARRPSGGFYFDPTNPPLQNISDVSELDKHIAAIQSFDAPGFADESLEVFTARAEKMHKTGSCVVFNLCCHILAAGQLLRGYENFMVDLLTEEAMVRKLLDILIEGYCQRVDTLAPALKNHTDVVLLNDDLGTQNGPMLSPDTYRTIIKPYQKKLFSYVKEKFASPILFHSCGAVKEFIPDLIEAGVDALNPVQISADGMDAVVLKKEFGKDITFWGGGADTQSVLNKMTPSEVKDSVKRNIDIFAPGGGFIFTQVHNIQPDVKPENI